MGSKSWAKADSKNAVAVRHDVERDEYMVEITPSRLSHSALVLKRSQIALMIATLQEVLSDYEK